MHGTRRWAVYLYSSDVVEHDLSMRSNKKRRVQFVTCTVSIAGTVSAVVAAVREGRNRRLNLRLSTRWTVDSIVEKCIAYSIKFGVYLAVDAMGNRLDILYAVPV